VDVATPAVRRFFGFDFRIEDKGANYEEVYLRQHKSELPDAMQYTPVLNTGDIQLCLCPHHLQAQVEPDIFRDIDGAGEAWPVIDLPVAARMWISPRS
jgi:hypothetical protein